MVRRFVVTDLLDACARLVLAHEKTAEHPPHAPTDRGKGWPHVWLGTTMENQEEANRRIPHLVAIPAAVRFLSVELMVEPVNVAPWLVPISHDTRHPDWVRGLRDRVHAAGVKLFVEQAGCNHALWASVTGKDEDPAQWPADLPAQGFQR